MTCKNCGSDLRDGVTFCTSCGSRVEAEPVAPPTDVPEPPSMPVSTPMEPEAPAPDTPVYNPYAPPPANVHGVPPPAAPVYNPYAPPPIIPVVPGSTGKSKTGLVIGLVIAGVVLLTAVMIIGFWLIASPFIESLEDVFTPHDRESGRDDAKDTIIVDHAEEFDLLMDELFEDWITADALSMNYFLADPDSLNIERPGPTFGDVLTAELIIESKQETEELSKRLDGFEYDLLRHDQQIVFDILRRNIKLYKILDREEDYSYYTGYIRPLIGIQVQLPILLAEFNFYTPDDIERYLDLLGDTERYFNDMIEFERERSRRGFFQSEYNVDKITEQIESYLEAREDNLLITVFDNRIDNYDGLDANQREVFKQRNREMVLGNVLPAYETLLDAMHELRGVGSFTGGLADLPGGKEFAHALLRLRTGSDKPVDDLEIILDYWLEETYRSIIITLRSSDEIYDRLMDDLLEIKDGTPEEYISALQRDIARDFPPIDETRLVVLEVHESLQEHTSPAFYLAPAIDRFNENVVYVNPASISTNLFLFTALAHESYPGHMYQTVYFRQQFSHPVRVSLSNSGYTEGWATYAEMTSYFFTELNYEEAELMWNLRLFDMLLQANIDFGVNVLGWSFDDAFDLLKSFNYNDIDTAEYIYNSVIGIPLNALNYALGYIELTELMNEAYAILGENFEFIEFHRFFLDFGPAPYPLLREHMIRRFG